MDELQKSIKELFWKHNIKIVPLTKWQIQKLAFILSLKEIGFTNEEIVEMITHRNVE
jgi:hypothetical protein